MPDIQIGNYSPESIVATISKGDLVWTLTGFADGTFLTIERMVPSSEPYIGADLSGGRVKRKNRSATATFTLHQYSETNKVLQDLQRADENDDGNTWVFNFGVKDASGQSLFFSSQTVINSPPSVAYSTTTETRDWSFFMFNCDFNVGGNTPLDPAAVAAVEAVGGNVDPRWVL